MADHYVKGCTKFRSYARDNLVNVTTERLCGALGIPIIHMRQNSVSFGRRVSEPSSEAAANLLGLSMADCRTETDMAVAP